MSRSAHLMSTLALAAAGLPALAGPVEEPASAGPRPRLALDAAPPISVEFTRPYAFAAGDLWTFQETPPAPAPARRPYLSAPVRAEKKAQRQRQRAARRAQRGRR